MSNDKKKSPPKPKPASKPKPAKPVQTAAVGGPKRPS